MEANLPRFLERNVGGRSSMEASLPRSLELWRQVLYERSQLNEVLGAAGRRQVFHGGQLTEVLGAVGRRQVLQGIHEVLEVDVRLLVYLVLRSRPHKSQTSGLCCIAITYLSKSDNQLCHIAT